MAENTFIIAHIYITILLVKSWNTFKYGSLELLYQTPKVGNAPTKTHK